MFFSYLLSWWFDSYFWALAADCPNAILVKFQIQPENCAWTSVAGRSCTSDPLLQDKISLSLLCMLLIRFINFSTWSFFPCFFWVLSTCCWAFYFRAFWWATVVSCHLNLTPFCFLMNFNSPETVIFVSFNWLTEAEKLQTLTFFFFLCVADLVSLQACGRRRPTKK